MTALNSLKKDLTVYHCTTKESCDNILKNGIIYNYNLNSSQDQDFGYGFYVHTELKRAQNYCNRMCKKIGEKPWIIMEFKVNPEIFNLKILELNYYNDEFAEFIFDNRTKNIKGNYQHEYDIVSGCMSDSNPLEVIIGYDTGEYTKQESLELLKKSTSSKQVCCCTEKACSMLSY